MVLVLLMWNLERMKYRRGIVNLLVARNYHSRHECQRVRALSKHVPYLTTINYVLNASIMGVLSVDSSVGLLSRGSRVESMYLHTRVPQNFLVYIYALAAIIIHHQLQFQQCGEGKHRYLWCFSIILVRLTHHFCIWVVMYHILVDLKPGCFTKITETWRFL